MSNAMRECGTHAAAYAMRNATERNGTGRNVRASKTPQKIVLFLMRLGLWITPNRIVSE